MCPNWKKGVKTALIAGTIGAVAAFAISLILSQQAPATDISLTGSLRPWWRLSNWCIAGGAFSIVGGSIGFLAAFRPSFRDDRNR